MTPTYTDPFGGGTIDPAVNSFRSLALTTVETLLAWPGYEAVGYTSAAAKIDITASVPAGSLRLPPANAVSAGVGLLFRNLSTNVVDLENSDGGTIAAIAPGQARLVFVTDNSSEAGVWASVVFGVGVGALDVGAAAGFGLQANGVQLEADWPAMEVSTNFVVNSALRASVLIWSGGAGAATFDLASSLGAGFVVGFRNAGTGILTLTPTGGELIDGAGSVALQPQESCLVFTTGAASFYSIGRGRNQQFNFTLLIKDISASGTIALTPTEAANVVQRYTGALVSNTEVVLPSVVQVYYISNQTSGAFTVTFKTAGVGTSVSVPTGQNAVLFCDGLNVINNSTTVSGLTSIILSAGALGTPSLAFSGDTSTGVYRPVAGSVGVVGVGTEIARFSGVAAGVNYLTITNAVAGGTPSIAAVGPAANINIALAPKGTGAVTLPLGAVATPSYAFSGDANTGFWSPGADQLAVSTAGVEALRIDASQRIGIGGLPSGWSTSFKAIDMAVPGAAGAVAVGGNSIRMSYNAFFDGTDFRYKISAAASALNVVSDGVHVFTAPAGIAGNVASFTERLFVTTDGRLSGTALHNNAGDVSGAVAQYIASGTYTPVLTNGVNVGASSADLNANWIRVGNVVTVWGLISIDPIAASAETSLDISLPIPSGLFSGTQLSGIATRNATGSGRILGSIAADTVNDRANLGFFNDANLASTFWNFGFTYVVV
jgi:hypothetical protein